MLLELTWRRHSFLIWRHWGKAKIKIKVFLSWRSIVCDILYPGNTCVVDGSAKKECYWRQLQDELLSGPKQDECNGRKGWFFFLVLLLIAYHKKWRMNQMPSPRFKLCQFLPGEVYGVISKPDWIFITLDSSTKCEYLKPSKVLPSTLTRTTTQLSGSFLNWACLLKTRGLGQVLTAFQCLENNWGNWQCLFDFSYDIRRQENLKYSPSKITQSRWVGIGVAAPIPRLGSGGQFHSKIYQRNWNWLNCSKHCCFSRADSEVDRSEADWAWLRSSAVFDPGR